MIFDIAQIKSPQFQKCDIYLYLSRLYVEMCVHILYIISIYIYILGHIQYIAAKNPQ